MPRRTIRYCTGLRCEHWGQVPEAFNELNHLLECPECHTLMGTVPGHPHDAGYRSGTQVTPILKPCTEAP